MSPRDVQTLTEAKALSAMAHPLRSRLLDALSVHGPSTASALAARLDEAVGNVSHHLKVLAQARLIDEAPELARDRRERWWRLSSPSTRWSTAEMTDPAAVDAALAAERLQLTRQLERARAWLDAREPGGPWEDASFAMQRWLRLSPDELRELNDELLAVLDRWAARPSEPAEARDGHDPGGDREPVLVFARGFPSRP
jgi:DNA-binding transcriptional ArsR family regulator